MGLALSTRATRTCAVLLLAATLGGCAAVAPDRLQQDPRYAIPPGSTLVLNRPLRLPGAGDILYLQHGRPLRHFHVQEVYPHCYLETREVPDGPVTVPPTELTITAVERSFHFVGLPAPAGRLVTVSSAGNGDGGGGLSQWFYLTRMTLEPADPAVDIFRLTCQADRLDAQGPATETHHLTVAQIREALGDLFTLELSR